MAYTPKTWVTGETIQAADLNHIETGLEAISAPGAIDTENLENNAVKREKIDEYMRNVILNAAYNNLWGYGTITKNKKLTNTGVLSSDNDYDTSDFIPVNAGDVIIGYGSRQCMFASDKTTVLHTGVWNNMSQKINGMAWYEIPDDGTKWFRICYYKPTALDGTSPQMIFKADPIAAYLLVNGSYGGDKRKLYCIGDSITRGMYANPGSSSSTGLTGYGYPYWIGMINYYNVVNLGESGGGYALKGTQTSSNGKDIVDNNTFSDADIVTIAFGINDYKSTDESIHLGSMSSTSGDGTVIGNMKYMIETLMTKKPTAQIIVMLPMNQNRFGYADMSESDNWSFGYAFRESKTLTDYRNAIKECANHYNVKVVDTEEICPINRLNIRSVCGDGLHPTMDFYKQMGQALAPHIR